jgi:hypothetical protein
MAGEKTNGRGWFMTFRSDPDSIEIFGALMKIIVAILLALAVQRVVAEHGQIPTDLQPGGVALLGRFVYPVMALLVFHGFYQIFSVVNNHLWPRRILSAVSLAWWGWFASIILETQGPQDLRFSFLVLLGVFKIWVMWRLWLVEGRE